MNGNATTCLMPGAGEFTTTSIWRGKWIGNHSPTTKGHSLVPLIFSATRMMQNWPPIVRKTFFAPTGCCQDTVSPEMPPGLMAFASAGWRSLCATSTDSQTICHGCKKMRKPLGRTGENLTILPGHGGPNPRHPGCSTLGRAAVPWSCSKPLRNRGLDELTDLVSPRRGKEKRPRKEIVTLRISSPRAGLRKVMRPILLFGSIIFQASAETRYVCSRQVQPITHPESSDLY